MPKSMLRAVGYALVLSLAWSSLRPAAVAASANPARPFVVEEPPKPITIKGRFTVTSLGDLINAHPIAQTSSPDLSDLLRLAGGGDVSIANQETQFFDLKAFRGYAPGSPYDLLGEPALATDLKAIGIDMVSTANNHGDDWGVEGLRETTRLLDAAGIVHAGDGATLADAQAPRYFVTPKGRVALIATTSTFRPGAKAQDAMGDVPARPGISGLRLREITIVRRQALDQLRAAAGRSKADGDLVEMINTRFAQQIEQVYRAGAAPGFSYEMNSFDRDAILRNIRKGKDNADLAVFAIHAHENADGMDDLAIGLPADFLVSLAHDAVDAGADVVMGGGPHSLRGIEIYRGKPIFYGLGVFMFGGKVVLTQDQQTERYGAATSTKSDPANPKDGSFRTPASWDEGVIATTTFKDGALEEVRLYPLDRAATPAHSGANRERLASPERARQILESLRRASIAFGTRIEIRGAVGIIRP